MNDISQKREKARKLYNTNRLPDALRLYTELCHSHPDAESHFMLGMISSLYSNHALSEKHFLEAIKYDPNSDSAWSQLGTTQATLGKYETAVNSLRNAITLNPNNSNALNNLGNIYRELGKISEAEACYRASIKLNKKDSIALNNLANIYLTQCDYDKAEMFYKEAIKHNKTYFDAYYNLGVTHQSKGDYKLALNYYKRAQKLNPNNFQPQSAIANLYEKQGNYSKSLEYIEPLINRNIITTDIADTFSKICIKKKEYDRGIDAIKRCLAANISPINEQALRFSLGDIYDKKEMYDEAFIEYSSANNMRPYNYNKEAIEQYFNNIKNTFINLGSEPKSTSGNLSKKPVFILGMPRSGTSLIEQILSSHSKVTGAGELPYIGAFTNQLSSSSNFPNSITTIAQDRLYEISNSYLQKIEALDKYSMHITDKMPHNFLYIGFIRMLFPSCKIIHCLRDPLDVCLSIYFHNFNQNHPYSDNLKNLGHYYNQYRDLMNTWHNLYDNFIIDISYEDLLGDPVLYINKILDHLGLTWEDNCLKFNESRRTVSTPSYEQVKQPLYKTSMHRWHNYSSHIDDLINSINNQYLLADNS